VINFRYHLVSLTAVFLALTVGLILGTAALNGPAIDALRETTQSLRDNNAALRTQVAELEEELGDDQSFASEIAPSYLDAMLAGTDVLVVALPGADSDVVDGVMEMLGYADAGEAGRITALDDFFNPNNDDQLADLVDEITPDTMEAPVTYDGVEAMSTVLAALLTGVTDDEEPVVTRGDITTALTSLTELGMFTVEEEPTGTAQAVLIVAGGAATDSGAEARNRGMVRFASAFADVVPTVYGATTSTGDGNPVILLRAEDADAGVSTVDNVVTVQGRIAAVAALAEMVADGTVFHLGTGEGNEGLVPAAP
jgi:hypothetical protein